MTAFSLLDLVPVIEGGSVAQALANAADMARHAEACGYNRYWVAEHHNMPAIASANFRIAPAPRPLPADSNDY